MRSVWKLVEEAIMEITNILKTFWDMLMVETNSTRREHNISVMFTK